MNSEKGAGAPSIQQYRVAQRLAHRHRHVVKINTGSMNRNLVPTSNPNLGISNSRATRLRIHVAGRSRR